MIWFLLLFVATATATTASGLRTVSDFDREADASTKTKARLEALRPRYKKRVVEKGKKMLGDGQADSVGAGPEFEKALEALEAAGEISPEEQEEVDTELTGEDTLPTSLEASASEPRLLPGNPDSSIRKSTRGKNKGTAVSGPSAKGASKGRHSKGRGKGHTSLKAKTAIPTSEKTKNSSATARGGNVSMKNASVKSTKTPKNSKNK